MSLLATYSIQNEAHTVLWEGTLLNPRHKSLPDGIQDAARKITFSGSKLPSIPINWRFAESVSALKAFEGAMLNVLLHNKYRIPYQNIHINTDHAQLFIMSPFPPLTQIEHASKKSSDMPGDLQNVYEEYFPNRDIHHTVDDRATSNIYKTGDGKYYHVHASLNPNISQKALGIDQVKYLNASSFEQACIPFQEATSKYSSKELDTLMNDQHRQAGTICYSIDEFRATDHAKANAHVGLYEIHYYPSSIQRPSWWSDIPGRTSHVRPLFGLKIVDLTRIIAAPSIVRDLAEMGASVMRITAPHVADLSQLQLDLGWGKWNAHLDLRKQEHRAQLENLIMDADVVIDGYRPDVLKKWGFGKNEILDLVKGREKGIIYAHENCYGWNGPWARRSGWQQISDAVTGVSLEFGRAMGHDEPVTPVFPNSDFCTGIAGATGILNALIMRAQKGGSFVVDIALNYYSQWLISSCGTYPPEIWNYLWTRYDRFVFRSMDNMTMTIPAYMKMLHEKKAPIFDETFFEIKKNGALGVDVKTIKPILVFEKEEEEEKESVKLEYNVGSRPNGMDMAKWPSDLMTEAVV